MEKIGRFFLRKNKGINVHFREHLTIDKYEGNPDLLNSKQQVLNTLNSPEKAFGVKKLAEVQIY